jgi:acetolactate synthase-1/2/3 large subunit|tara:strand:- start:1340 stop:3151 length:1812 start_codon:yes stop_codon:yes gene_type:complete
MVKRRLLESSIDMLIENGIDTFFLVTGGAIVPTIDYIGQHKKAKYYCFQHEQAAAMAAEGYYRTTDKIGAVLTTSGPGAQNLLNGICGCWYESIPCIFITGQVSTYESSDCISTNPRQLGFQETPIVDSVIPFTKYAEKIKTTESVQRVIKTAIEQCKEGRFGPCLIDFPVDMQTSVSNFEIEKVEHKPVVDLNLSKNVLKLEKLINNSKRPLILLGHGIRLSNSIKQARKLVDKFNIPFVVSWGAFDIIDHSHHLFTGDIGVYGKRGANFAIQNCDLLISIGSRLDTRQTGGNLAMFAREATKVMVDIDFDELHKGRGLNIDLPIQSDAGLFIDEVIRTIKEVPVQDQTWLQKCTEWKNWKEERPVFGGSSALRKYGRLTSYEALDKLNKLIDDDEIIIPDEGGHLVWCMQTFKLTNQRMFSNFGNSSMGYALPSAIGAAIGTGKRVICIDGDGGFQMNIQELQTVKNYNLPIKIFIINNGCYGIIKQFQDAYCESRYTATDGHKDYTLPDFEKVAKAYDIEAITIENKGDIDSKLEYVMNYDGPILCNILIDPEQKLIPKLEFGNPLEDMSPYLTDEQINNNMIIDTIERRDNTKGWVNLK